MAKRAYYRDPFERFFASIRRSESGRILSGVRCLLWTGARDTAGYGNLNVAHPDPAKRKQRAHRFAYSTYKGAIPDGLQVLHKCDNPTCVEVAHLFLGTPADNSTDKVSKSRQARGKTLPQSKLDEGSVLRIRTLYREGRANISQLSRRFRVSLAVVHSVVHGKTWKHVPGALADAGDLRSRRSHA